MKVRLIGDVHNKYPEYIELIKDCEYSIQLGDFGLRDYNILNQIDPTHHILIAGNHDNYYLMNDYPHFKQKYGIYNLGGFEFFYIAGAYSIDSAWRIPGVSWWQEEELNYSDSINCIELYKDIKPQIVLSHECPDIIFKQIVLNPMSFSNSNTRRLMDVCLNYYSPLFWWFGHHHRSKKIHYHNCLFQCLNELEWVDIEF